MTSDEMDMIMTGAAEMTREVNETIGSYEPSRAGEGYYPSVEIW